MQKIDTDQVKKSGQDMVKLSRELGEIIDNLYYKIYNMPISTREWVGNSAEIFSKYVTNVEKKDTMAFVNTLYQFGECLIDSAERYEFEIRKNI